MPHVCQVARLFKEYADQHWELSKMMLHILAEVDNLVTTKNSTFNIAHCVSFR